ncbi:unnamed protein product, partial [marine sediment metagenome]
MSKDSIKSMTAALSAGLWNDNNRFGRVNSNSYIVGATKQMKILMYVPTIVI